MEKSNIHNTNDIVLLNRWCTDSVLPKDEKSME